MQLVIDEQQAAALLCPRCAQPVDVRSPHVVVRGSAVELYCSPACKHGALRGGTDATPVAPPPRRWMSPLATGGAVLGSLFVADIRTDMPLPIPSLAPPPPAIVAPAPVAAAPVPPPAPVFGPAWPPTEEQWVAVISRDAWIHPLNGPVRRMPIRDSRVFGAERAGKRPPGCRNGHCGVDIGEVWGEPVMAAHAGVVERVQRGPNEAHGGLYVRLSHRGGTVFTQYFHLAAIPRSLRPGDQVAVGQVLGLVGDTGVRNAAAHLHFTISVKAAPYLPEQYIDPEPLIALWPLRIPALAGGGVVSIESPGRVRGAAAKRRKAKRRTHDGDDSQAPPISEPIAAEATAATAVVAPP